MLLRVDAPWARIAAKGSDPPNPMAGNDDWDWIAATCVSDGPGAGVQLCCDIFVSSSFTEGNFQDSLKNVLLESRAGWRKRKIEGIESTGKIGIELTDGFCQDGRWLVLLTSRPPSIESHDGVSILKNRDVANGAVD